MDKSSKILLLFLALLTVLTIGATFWKTVVEQDYIVSEEEPVEE